MRLWRMASWKRTGLYNSGDQMKDKHPHICSPKGKGFTWMLLKWQVRETRHMVGLQHAAILLLTPSSCPFLLEFSSLLSYYYCFFLFFYIILVKWFCTMIDIKCSWGFVMIIDDTKRNRRKKKYQKLILLLVKILSSFFFFNFRFPAVSLLYNRTSLTQCFPIVCRQETPGDCTPPVCSNYMSLGQVQIVYWHISGDNDPVSPAFINYIYIYLFYKNPSFTPFPKYCFSLCKTIRTWKQRCPCAK